MYISTDDPADNKNRIVDDIRRVSHKRGVDRLDDRYRPRKKRDQGYLAEIYKGDDEGLIEG